MENKIAFIIPEEDMILTQEDAIGLYDANGNLMFFRKECFKDNVFYCARCFAGEFIGKYELVKIDDIKKYLYNKGE